MEHLPDSGATGRLIDFVRRVRDAGIPVSTAQTIDLTNATALIGLRRYDDLRSAAQCTLATRFEHLPVIDAEFERLWDDLANLPAPRLSNVQGASLFDFQAQAGTPEDEVGTNSQSGSPGNMDAARVDGDTGGAPGSDGIGDAASRSSSGFALYSAGEALVQKDFAEYTAAELEEAERFIRTVRWRPPMRRSRRRRSVRHGSEIDMRRLLRLSLAHGGEIVEFPARAKCLRPRSLVVLCDVSGSMDAYTRVLLRFLHGMYTCCPRVEVFLFGTRLTRITHLLARESTETILNRVAAKVMDWSGGTRIAESLSVFNRVWARRVAAHGAVVMVISDGWERGDPARLSRELARLRRLSYRLIWLNPHLGTPGYEPLTQGMQAAIAHVDHFVPAHNLASLDSIAQLLNDLPS